jgi:hypothetical protein
VAIQGGHVECQYEVSVRYMHGKGVEMSELEAIRWLKRAGATSANAAFELACCLEQGLGMRADGGEMRKYLEIAAQAGHSGAQSKLGTCYVSGKFGRRLPKEGFMWALRAAQNGHAPSMTTVANMLFNGVGVSQDKAEAMDWYLQAARVGDPEAQYTLGRCNAEGIAVPHADLEEAGYWYREAALQGYGPATAALADLPKRVVVAESSKSNLKSKSVQMMVQAAGKRL